MILSNGFVSSVVLSLFSTDMKTTYIYLFVIAVLAYSVFINQRDKQLLKQYDACLQSTQHSDCPDSWKTKPAFSHR